jgi:tetratricopeptide (TPR) repeat protein
LRAAAGRLQSNRPEEAEQLAQQGISAYPRDPRFLSALATARYRRGRYEGALEAAGQSLALDNSSALSYFLLGATWEKLGDPESAGWYYRQANRIDSKYALPPALSSAAESESARGIGR